MIRIISGKYKNLVFKRAPKTITRITPEKIRESFFSIINFDIENATCLEPFAGSGIISAEFLSRGAKKVYVNELNKKIFELLNENYKKLDNKNFLLSNNRAEYYLKNVNDIFDFIYLDPPYKKRELITKSLEIINNRNLLNKNGKIIIECDYEITEIVNFKIIKKQNYGRTNLFFIEKKD